MRNSRGFAAIETLLIVMILVIIGGTGWYVWNSKNLTNKILDQAASTSQNQLGAKGKTNSTSRASQKYLDINEWGVKMLETDQSSDAYYVLDSRSDNSNPPTYFNIDSRQLDSLKANDGTSCAGEYIGIIGRYGKNDPSWKSDPIEVQDIQSGGKTIGDYIYTFSIHKQYAAPCLYDSTNDYAPIQANLDVYNAKVKAYEDMFNTIQVQ